MVFFSLCYLMCLKVLKPFFVCDCTKQSFTKVSHQETFFVPTLLVYNKRQHIQAFLRKKLNMKVSKLQGETYLKKFKEYLLVWD